MELHTLKHEYCFLVCWGAEGEGLISGTYVHVGGAEGEGLISGTYVHAFSVLTSFIPYATKPYMWNP